MWSVYIFIVLDKGKSVQTYIDHLEYSDESNSSFAPINLGIESSITSASITNVVDGSNSSAVSSIDVDSRNNSTIITQR